MNLRFSGYAIGAIALLALAAGPMTGQAEKPAKPATAVKTSKTPAVPRTAEGKPDLQGFWTNATFTPLERPPELAAKEFFTEAEAAAYEKQKRLQDNSQSESDIHYDNRVWQDESYAKIVSNRRTSMIFDPPDGKIPPLTPAGQKHAAAVAESGRRRNAAESADSRNLAERCISWGNEGPPMIGSTYNANLQIVQTAAQVVISHEIIHGVRAIPLDGRPHLPPALRQLGGDSRGRWEGDTLVVDSANFNDQTNFRGPPGNTRQDIFSSQDLHVVERFTMTDADTIVYRFTVEDPSTWTKPWSGELVMRRFAGPIFEYACHEGNYGLANILAGARMAEKAAAESREK